MLDLVAEELDAQRLAARRREDVDDAPSHRKLPSLVDAVDALVPGARERLGGPIETGLVACRDADRSGPHLRQRHSFRECCRGGTDEAPCREDVECASALTDEVRWRLQARGMRNATARKQCDAVWAEKPGCAVGRVPGVGVLGQEHEHATTELLVQRREEERERRLGDPGSTPKGLHERLEPLRRSELRDEACERGRRRVGVHAGTQFDATSGARAAISARVEVRWVRWRSVKVERGGRSTQNAGSRSRGRILAPPPFRLRPSVWPTTGSAAES